MAAALVAATALIAATAPSPAPPAAPPGATVHLKNDAFVPASITIRSGDSVTFVNDDDDAHTATADDASWDSEGLNQGQRWTHLFARSGTYTYHCTVHPFMKGEIIVRSAS